MTSKNAETFRAEQSRASTPLYRLYGYPIAHSAAPAFHNFVFSALGNKTSDPKEMSQAMHPVYSLWSSSKVTEEMLEDIRQPEFGGASVTMPLKSTIIPHLDEITQESRATGAVNTIVKVYTGDHTQPKLVGTNTDILGVKNSLTQAIYSQYPSLVLHPDATFAKAPSVEVLALVIGGGATTRSACQALFLMGVEQIYLVNRDVDEANKVENELPHLKIRHLQSCAQAQSILGKESVLLPLIVGAIPCLEPQTEEEKLVYAVVKTVLSIRYRNKIAEEMLPPDEHRLPFPSKRLFLDMAYKPRWTKLLAMAEEHSCHTVTGIHAMLEQGYAQQRMWLRGDPSPTVGSDVSILGERVEHGVRQLIEAMADVVVAGVEVDRSV